MDFIIRPAEPGDAAAIANVQVESWKTTYAGIVPDAFLASLSAEARTQSWQEQFAEGNALMFVAEDVAGNGGIIGFANGGALRTAVSGYDAELYALYLLRPRQRQGAGRMLCRALASGLRARSFNSMLLWVLEANPSVAFYKRLGGLQVAQQTIRIGDAELSAIAFGWTSLDRLIE